MSFYTGGVALRLMAAGSLTRSGGTRARRTAKLASRPSLLEWARANR